MSKPLQIDILRNIVLNSNVIDKIKEKNTTEKIYQTISNEEKMYCDNYFKEDLEKLATEFGVTFN